jgi:hypothetical protein
MPRGIISRDKATLVGTARQCAGGTWSKSAQASAVDR